MIQRTEYLQELIDFKDTRIIKVITGIRRCGKSTLFELFQNYLKENNVKDKNIISVNFENPDNDELLDYKKLYEYVKNKLDSNKMTYIFFDEIQVVSNFEKAVNGLFIKENVDIYITGSNAFMLSGELATFLSGRYIEIKMLPLSFKEFISSSKETNINKNYTKYITESSFPYAINLSGNQLRIREYLSGIYNTVVLKDIMGRGKINDQMMLESVIKFTFDNIGNLLSTTKIANTMTSEGRKINVHTVENYLSHLLNSYLLYKIGRYDIKGKQYLKTGAKYYLVDIGLRFYLLGTKNIDLGYILENIVYLELFRRGYQIYIGKVGNEEVDFVAVSKDGTIEYYQVAYTTKEQTTLNREIKPLENIRDHNLKYLLTLDEEPMIIYNGIRKINVLDWLMANYN